MDETAPKAPTFYSRPLSSKIVDYFLALIAISLISTTSLSIRIYRQYDVSNMETIMNRKNTGLKLYDRHGELFFTFNRAMPHIPTRLSEIPLVTQQAIIAAEDKHFYSHTGFSVHSIARSIYLNLKNGSNTYGGSTITQQLVKNAFLTNQKSLARKFKEIIIATKLERHNSKQRILEMYANSAYFGEGVFGIEAAAQTYFNKSAKDLTLGESAILAGLLPAPSSLPPLERQRIVLNHMKEQGYITEKQKEDALREHIVFSRREDGVNKIAPHFALMVKQDLNRIYGEETVIRTGMKVTTTLDRSWQIYAENTVRQHIDTLQKNGAGNGATVAIDPTTGEIKALVGSVGWWQEGYGKVNMAISPRQTGSAFKPIVYATGIEERVLTASTILHDIPTTFAGSYKPRDYDSRWRGPVLVRRALANSLNVPAVEAINTIGIPRVVALARRLGISTMSNTAQYNLATALGSEHISLLDLTSAYGVFANNGTLHSPISILNIRDKYNKPIAIEKPAEIRAIDPRVAFIISSILSDNKARAEIFGNMLTISRPAAVKTGTTQNYRDGWTVGYTPNLVVGVWIGNNDNAPMGKIPASVGAAPLWKNLMETFLAQTPAQDFIAPAGLSTYAICRNGGLALSNTNTIQEYFLPGTEPTHYCAPSPNPGVSPSLFPIPTTTTNDKNNRS